MKKILFINTPSCFSSYSGTRINAVVQIYPLLSHATFAAIARQKGHKVEILDLGIILDWQNALKNKVEKFKPDIIGMTSTTPLISEVSKISFIIRKLTDVKTKLIIGGPHVTALPNDTLDHSAFDIAVLGEGEVPFIKILDDTSYSKIPGIYYKENGEIIQTSDEREIINDIESIPYPALDLYDLSKYKCSRILNKVSPMMNYMTSRGCAWNCSFCNKNIFGSKMRFKSPEAVIDEIKYLQKLGIRELRIIDDMFTANMDRAKKICELILENNLKFPWTLSAGIRVDKVDLEFLQMAKRAGLYQLALGFESGDQKSLDSIGKGYSVEQSYKAMALVKKAGIESVGFFMFGLPADTEKSLVLTTKFAKKLSPSYAKVTITVPFPGTRIYDEYKSKDLIKSNDWSKYNLHSIGNIYEHPNISMDILKKHYNKFYTSFYLRPGYLALATLRTLKAGTFFHHAYFGAQTFFPKILKTNPSKKNNY